jgi:hypothetical protein
MELDVHAGAGAPSCGSSPAHSRSSRDEYMDRVLAPLGDPQEDSAVCVCPPDLPLGRLLTIWWATVHGHSSPGWASTVCCIPGRFTDATLQDVEWQGRYTRARQSRCHRCRAWVQSRKRFASSLPQVPRYRSDYYRIGYLGGEAAVSHQLLREVLLDSFFFSSHLNLWVMVKWVSLPKVSYHQSQSIICVSFINKIFLVDSTLVCVSITQPMLVFQGTLKVVDALYPFYSQPLWTLHRSSPGYWERSLSLKWLNKK